MNGLDRYKLGQSHAIGDHGVRGMVKKAQKASLAARSHRWEHQAFFEHLECHMPCQFFDQYAEKTRRAVMDPGLYVAEKHYEGLRVWVAWDASGMRYYSRTVDHETMFPLQLPVPTDEYINTTGKRTPRVIFDGIVVLKDRRIKQTLERRGIKLVGGSPQRVLWELMSRGDAVEIQSKNRLVETVLFDIPWANRWVGGRTFTERRSILERVLATFGPLPSASISKLYNPAKIDSMVRRFGWDGAVHKKKDSPYCASPSRSAKWVKRAEAQPEPWYRGPTAWYSPESPNPQP